MDTLTGVLPFFGAAVYARFVSRGLVVFQPMINVVSKNARKFNLRTSSVVR